MGIDPYEQVWAENVRTLEGKYLHERTDDPFEDETRKISGS
jgi:CRISPR-associated exonuclease Cas4